MERASLRRVSGVMPTDYSYIERAAAKKWGAIANAADSITNSIAKMELSQDRTAADLAASKYRDEMSQWSIDQAATLNQLDEFGDRNYETLEDRFKDKSESLKESLGEGIKYNANKARYSLSVDGVNRTVNEAVMGDVLNARTEKARADWVDNLHRSPTLEERHRLIDEGVAQGLVKESDAVSMKHEAEFFFRKQGLYKTIDVLDGDKLNLMRQKIDSWIPANPEEEELFNQASNRLNKRAASMLSNYMISLYENSDELQSLLALDEARQKLLSQAPATYGFSDFDVYSRALNGVTNRLKEAHSDKLRTEIASEKFARKRVVAQAIRDGSAFISSGNKEIANNIFDTEIVAGKTNLLEIAGLANQFGSPRGGFLPDSLSTRLAGMLRSTDVKEGSVTDQYMVALSMLKEMTGLKLTGDLEKARSIAVTETNPSQAAQIWKLYIDSDRLEYPEESINELAESFVKGLGLDSGGAAQVAGMYKEQFNAIYAGSQASADRYAQDWLNRHVHVKSDGSIEYMSPLVIFNTGDPNTDARIRTNILAQYQEISREHKVNLMGDDVIAIPAEGFDAASNPVYHFEVNGYVLHDDEGNILSFEIEPSAVINVDASIVSNVEQFFIEASPLGTGAVPPIPATTDSFGRRQRAGRKILNTVYKFLDANAPNPDSKDYAGYQEYRADIIGSVVYYLGYIGYPLETDVESATSILETDQEFSGEATP